MNNYLSYIYFENTVPLSLTANTGKESDTDIIFNNFLFIHCFNGFNINIKKVSKSPILTPTPSELKRAIFNLSSKNLIEFLKNEPDNIF